jgi:hypothetical protein
MLGLALAAAVLMTIGLPTRAAAQDDNQDDPPSRVARLGYMEGSVSFEPAGENDWVGADDNRPMTTGDKIWADKDSRAELQLGSAVIRLSANTGVSFLNLDDHTAQVQLSSGAINIRVRSLEQNDVFEIDTPNLAFSIYQPGSYRLEASEDGSNTVVTIREGDGEATGNGQTYKIHSGQSATFSGTDSLNADVEQIGEPDQFDNWAYNRDHRHENSRSAQYVSNDMVGYDDLDDNGDWRDDSSYGHVWFPHVEVGWAPYRQGHWAWIDPWGYTWVDDSPWGYAPFHYGRWVSVGGRWGWIAGPREVHAVYAPALVVFVGGGGGFGGNIGWFPLGPREVFVPSYHVSRAYVERVNISNTTVNTTTITNVYNTTIINKNTTNITNVTYVNRNVQGAVTAVPQRTFSSAQPVARAAVKVNAQEIASAPVTRRVEVNPTREAVLGAKASTVNHVTAPPAAVANRQVIAKKAPPPPPPAFAARQQAMAAHPGQPLPKQQVASLRPAAAAEAHPAVKVAPPGKPATPTTGHPPANQPNAARPGQPAPGAPANQPGNRPGNQPAPNERPGAAQPNNRPNQPENQPPAAQPNNRPNQPENRPPAAQPNNRPNQPENRPPAAQPNNKPNQPENRPPAAQPNNRPNQPENRPPAAQPNNRASQPENRPPAAQPNNRPNQPENRPPAAQPNNRPNQPENRPPAAQPNNRPSQPENRPPAAQPNNRQENRPPAAEPNNRQENRPPAAKPAPPPQKQQQKPQTPEEKKKQDEKKPPGV